MRKRKRSRLGARAPKAEGILMEYHTIPFSRFHLHPALKRVPEGIHPCRVEFWHLVPKGIYPSKQGAELVSSYIDGVTARLQRGIEKRSLSALLHVYRRLSPMAIGTDSRPMTIRLVRATLEAAFQKYAKADLCSWVGDSTELKPAEILRGALVEDAQLWKLLKDNLMSQPQLVLRDFGPEELAEFYLLEKLAFEVWKGSAILRALGKGAPLRVFNPDEVDGQMFADDRSEDLNFLIENYDDRAGAHRGVSATGTIFDGVTDHESRVVILLPLYNADHIPFTQFAQVFRKAADFNLFGSSESSFSNFIWFPFNLSGFFHAHQPFATAFREAYGFEMNSLGAVLAALGANAISNWRTQPEYIWKNWQRAYEGPALPSPLISEIKKFLPMGLKLVPLDIEPSEVEVEKVFEFLCLDDEKRNSIDLQVAGPHAIFLPSTESRVFIDYAWIMQRLYRLFHGLKLEDQNFKGALLEEAVRRQPSVLPVQACKGNNILDESGWRLLSGRLIRSEVRSARLWVDLHPTALTFTLAVFV